LKKKAVELPEVADLLVLMIKGQQKCSLGSPKSEKHTMSEKNGYLKRGRDLGKKELLVRTNWEVNGGADQKTKIL